MQPTAIPAMAAVGKGGSSDPSSGGSHMILPDDEAETLWRDEELDASSGTTELQSQIRRLRAHDVRTYSFSTLRLLLS